MARSAQDHNRCEACALPAEVIASDRFDGFTVECERCGSYEISGSAAGRKMKPPERVRLSGWIREQELFGFRPRLMSRDISRVIALPLPTMAERADNLLSFIASNEHRLGDEILFQDEKAYDALTYAREGQERDQIFHFLQWRGHITGTGTKRISPKGYDFLDGLRKRNQGESQAFIAMWFSPEVGRVYEDGFFAGISAAGYKPVRVDKVEHAGRIDDEIIAQIRRSRFIVADFTGQRGGVYFEAGFAMGLNIPVIWSCREDEIQRLHFDTRQFNCLLWQDDLEDLARRLQMRIEAVVGRGPIVTNA
jgi:hypothetical protein